MGARSALKNGRPSTPGVVSSSVWGRKVGNGQAEGRSEGTHLEDATNPIEIQSPGRDYLAFFLCMERPGKDTSFASLDDIPLDLDHGAKIVTLLNDRNRPADELLVRLTSSIVRSPRVPSLIHTSCLHSPVKR